MAQQLASDAKKSAADQLTSEFPAYAWVLQEPGVLAALSNTGITNTDQFLAALQQTEWWQNTVPSMRTAQMLQRDDPQGYAQQRGQTAAYINDQWKSMGLRPDDAAVNALSEQAMQQGWTTAQINDRIVSSIHWTGGNTNISLNEPGAAQTNVQQLKDVAAKYYLPLDNGTAESWAGQIAAGEKTANDYTALMQQQAKVKYANSPDILNALNQGLSTDDAMSSYKSEAAKLLNLGDAQQVDFMNNPMFSKVLNYTDPKTGQNRVMSFGEMQNYIRSTPQYDHTPGAIANMSDALGIVAKNFGLPGGA